MKAGDPLYQIERGRFEAAVQPSRQRSKNACDAPQCQPQKQRADELIKTNAISGCADDRAAAAEAEGEELGEGADADPEDRSN